MCFKEKQRNEFVNQNNLEKIDIYRIKWFNNECKKLKYKVRKIGRHKGKDPQNNLLRVKYMEN